MAVADDLAQLGDRGGKHQWLGRGSVSGDDRRPAAWQADAVTCLMGGSASAPIQPQ
jgi:hypothetical protein